MCRLFGLKKPKIGFLNIIIGNLMGYRVAFFRFWCFLASRSAAGQVIFTDN